MNILNKKDIVFRLPFGTTENLNDFGSDPSLSEHRRKNFTEHVKITTDQYLQHIWKRRTNSFAEPKFNFNFSKHLCGTLINGNMRKSPRRHGFHRELKASENVCQEKFQFVGYRAGPRSVFPWVPDSEVTALSTDCPVSYLIFAYFNFKVSFHI